MVDIFEFWSRIQRGEHIHPADQDVFRRLDQKTHGFNLKCLPTCFGGRLRSAPIVLLYLSPGFEKGDLRDARSEEGRDYYVRRWSGDEPIRALVAGRSSWMASRIRSFGPFDEIRDKIAILNIGAYHSKDVKSFAALFALPSSRISLEWAQTRLFPSAEAGERIVICMRSAACWGLLTGEQYGQGLFAPEVTRSGHFKRTRQNDRLIDIVRERLAQ